MDMTARISSVVVALLFAAGLIAVALSAAPQEADSQTGTAVTGWLWSDTIGWISMNCANTSSCGTSNYSVTIDTSGMLNGYAWSDNIGWIQFGELSSFPTGSGTVAENARMSSAALIGWARACAGTVNGDCSTMSSRTDGWDGWIALSGTNFGPTLTEGTFGGYSWGDTNVGWISWSGAQYSAQTTYLPCAASQGYQCVSGNSVHTAANCTVTTDVCASHGTGWFCATDNNLCTPPPPPTPGLNGDGSSGSLSARPSLVKNGETAQLIWTIEDATSCSVTGNGDSWAGLSSPGGGNTSSPILQQTTYTLHCESDGGTLDETATINIIPSWQER